VAARPARPAGHRFAVGIRQVVVNGTLAFDNGRFTGQRRGEIV